MKIGIIKPKFNKKQRKLSYIILPFIGIIGATVLLSLISNIDLSYFMVLLFSISIWLILDLYIEDYNQIGIIEIIDDKFNIELNGEAVSEVKMTDIEKIILKPNLGISKSNYTYKSYLCEIFLKDKKYQFEITREEIRKNKRIRKNILNKNTFDFIYFLKGKKLKLEVLDK